MRLRSMELRNYRRYSGHHEIVFPEGIVGLLGPNGAGKSTLIEALAWALYGQAATRTSADGLRSSMVGESEPVSVAVEFLLGGEAFRVVRTLKGKNLTPEAIFLRGNEQLAEGAKDVSAAIARKLGLDWRSFYTTVFTRQKELDAFSALTHTERKGLVERLLGISLLDDVVRKVRETNRNNSSRLEDRRTQTTDDDGRPKVELWQIRQEELQELQARLAEEEVDLGTAVQKAREQQGSADVEWKAAQLQKESHHVQEKLLTETRALTRSTQENLKALRKRLLELEAQKRELEQIEPSLAKLPETKDALADHERSKEKVNQRARLEEELGRLVQLMEQKQQHLGSVTKDLENKPDPTQQLMRLDEHHQEVVKKRDDVVHRIGDLKGEAKALEGQSSSIRLHLQQIETLGVRGNCPTCERPLKDHQPDLVAKYQKQLMDNNTAKGKLKTGIGDLEKELEVHSKQLKELNKQDARYNSIKTEVAGLMARSEALQIEIAGFNEHIVSIRKELGPLAKVEYHKAAHDEIKTYVESLQKLAGTVEELRRAIANKPKIENQIKTQEQREAEALTNVGEHERRLAELAFDPHIHAATEKAYRTATDRLRQAEVDLAGHEAKKVSVSKDLETTQTALKQQELLIKDINRLETEGTYNGRLEGLFKAFREHLLGRIAPLLAGYTSELIGPLTQGRYNQVQVDPRTYEIKVYDGAEAYPLARFSGGETDLVNLALRLAISRLLAERSEADLNLIILDEIFGSQDDQRRLAIMAGLQNLKKKFGQILLITHIEQVKEMVEVGLRVEETPEGGARVVEA